MRCIGESVAKAIAGDRGFRYVGVDDASVWAAFWNVFCYYCWFIATALVAFTTAEFFVLLGIKLGPARVLSRDCFASTPLLALSGATLLLNVLTLARCAAGATRDAAHAASAPRFLLGCAAAHYACSLVTVALAITQLADDDACWPAGVSLAAGLLLCVDGGRDSYALVVKAPTPYATRHLYRRAALHRRTAFGARPRRVLVGGRACSNGTSRRAARSECFCGAVARAPAWVREGARSAGGRVRQQRSRTR